MSTTVQIAPTPNAKSLTLSRFHISLQIDALQGGPLWAVHVRPAQIRKLLKKS
jgi:hypothetical protein